MEKTYKKRRIRTGLVVKDSKEWRVVVFNCPLDILTGGVKLNNLRSEKCNISLIR